MINKALIREVKQYNQNNNDFILFANNNIVTINNKKQPTELNIINIINGKNTLFLQKEIWSICISNIYNYIALNEEGEVRVIDLNKLKLINTTLENCKYTNSFISSKDGKLLFSIFFNIAKKSNELKIYNFYNMFLLNTHNISTSEANFIDIDSGNNKILIYDEIYDLKTFNLIKQLSFDGYFEKLLYSNDGKRIITVYAGDYDNFINIYDADSGELTKKIRVDDFGLKTHQRDDTGEYYLVEGEEWEPWNTLAVYLTPNDKYLILGTSDGITFIDIEEVKIVKYISNARTGIFACSQDGKYIVFEEYNNSESVLKLYEIIYE